MNESARVRERKGRVPSLVLGALASLGLAGCGGDGQPSGPVVFPAEALMSLASDAGRFVVTVRTSPQPPVRGVDAVQLQIDDSVGTPVDGLSIEAVPASTARDLHPPEGRAPGRRHL